MIHDSYLGVRIGNNKELFDHSQFLIFESSVHDSLISGFDPPLGFTPQAHVCVSAMFAPYLLPSWQETQHETIEVL